MKENFLKIAGYKALIEDQINGVSNANFELNNIMQSNSPEYQLLKSNNSSTQLSITTKDNLFKYFMLNKNIYNYLQEATKLQHNINQLLTNDPLFANILKEHPELDID